MTSTCYVGCWPPVTIPSHSATGPIVTHVSHLAFTGFDPSGALILGAVLVVSGIGFFVSDHMVRRKDKR